MTNSKVKTVIVNRTEQELVLRVGNQNCFSKLATIAVGRAHKVEIDVNWTYQEFSLELPANIITGTALKKIIVSSDDCCDFELMTVSQSGGKLQVDNIERGQLKSDHHHHHPPVLNMKRVNKWWSFFSWPPKFKPKFNWRPFRL